MAVEAYIQEAQPTGVRRGDLWLKLSSLALSVCVETEPKVRFMEVSRGAVPTVTVADVAGSIPAGGTSAAAGGWDTAGNRNTAITTMGEIKAQLNALLVALRQKGVVA